MGRPHQLTLPSLPPVRDDTAWSSTSTRTTLLVLVAPSVLLLLLINAYPFFSAANESLHNGTLISAGSFVGLDNYKTVLTSAAFWQAAEFTLLYTVVGVFGSWASVSGWR